MIVFVVQSLQHVPMLHVCYTGLIEMKTSGIMDLLDEECKLPKGSPDHFTDTVHSTHRGHFRLTVSV